MNSVIKLIKHDAASGVLLVIAAVFALILANSSLAGFYADFLNIPVTFRFGDFEIAKPFVLWINDGLMAIFFFLIGLEVKRELLEGQLSKPSQVLLPAVAAIAGIVFPALVYVAFNLDDAIAMRGWAIPSATDIAFAVGLYVLFGDRLPTSLKIFLLSVAIFDDIGAIIIIAIFYSQDLSQLSLGVALAGLAGLFVLNRFQVRSQAAYILVGVVVWAAVLKSGVHATLAGFALAWFIPLKLPNYADKPMAPHIEHTLEPWVGFLVLPLFAFANAGVRVLDASAETLFNPVSIGIATALFLGKQIGIFGSCWLVVKAGLAKLPEGASWRQLYGVCLLCGIGFTMSLFIGSLAFEEQGEYYNISVKVGVLMGSFLSAITAALVLAGSGTNKVKASKGENYA
ncbi:Na+/H+ antiporter NhaA [Paraferrimonas sedimenticola]|uniref:Na(+)/H(+) antiporter NhaA n=1 Tax=Paraferrimonas sedimenticola TaxID=375674 RepID=A0AA37RW34_9GAMM|nr:Na+/H+ antiporter NhaA [Paraferrimonas sedimenticola]GLP96286.1 Na(+)/H(+) antiporter NhaA [Paraferrimonas sedimenticola]